MKILVDFNVNDDTSVEAFTGWVNSCPFALTQPAVLIDTTPAPTGSPVEDGSDAAADDADDPAVQEKALAETVAEDSVLRGEVGLQEAAGIADYVATAEAGDIVESTMSEEDQRQHDIEKQNQAA